MESILIQDSMEACIFRLEVGMDGVGGHGVPTEILWAIMEMLYLVNFRIMIIIYTMLDTVQMATITMVVMETMGTVIATVASMAQVTMAAEIMVVAGADMEATVEDTGEDMEEDMEEIIIVEIKLNINHLLSGYQHLLIDRKSANFKY